MSQPKFPKRAHASSRLKADASGLEAVAKSGFDQVMKRQWTEAEIEKMTLERKRFQERELCHHFRHWIVSQVLSKVAMGRRATRSSAGPANSAEGLQRVQSMAVDTEAHLKRAMGQRHTAAVMSSTGAVSKRANTDWKVRMEADESGKPVYVPVGEANGLEVSWDLGHQYWALQEDDKVLYILPDPQGEKMPPISCDWKPGPDIEQSTIFGMTTSVPLAFDYFEVFEEAYEDEPPSLPYSHFVTPADGESTWKDIRGPYGENILYWLWTVRTHDLKHESLVVAYKSMMLGMINSDPSILRIRCREEPFKGQSLLHQACAGGEVDFVAKMLGNNDLTSAPWYKEELLCAHMTGQFLKQMNVVPDRLSPLVELATPEDDNAEYNGPTPLEVAMRAPREDEDSIRLVKMLLKQGASPIVYYSEDCDKPEKQRRVRYNILHMVGRSLWWEHWNVARHLSASRVQALIDLFLDVHSDVYKKWGLQMVSQENGHNLTPLKCAAMFGNEPAFVSFLECMQTKVWEWGRKKMVGFPLVELDSAAEDGTICALELMTLYKHGNLLTLGLMAEIVNLKWERFGQIWVRRWICIHFVALTCTAMVVLDDTDGYNAVRWTCKHIVLGMTATLALASFLLFYFCAYNEVWFRSLDHAMFFRDHSRLNLWDLLAFRNIFELCMMSLLVLTPPWYQAEWIRDDPTYQFVWHSFASAWFLVVILFSLRYFELDRRTSAMALTIPEVFTRDVVPFSAFFLVIFWCFAIAIRIACQDRGSHHEGHKMKDHEFGTFWGVVKSLEEAIHGPDVQWRNIVEHHPRLGGVFFILFLWICTIMLNVLIAMFGMTFDDLQQHVEERLIFRRAMFCITYEKLFPQWYHASTWWGPQGCVIGEALGGTSASTNKALEDTSSSSEEEALVTGDRSSPRAYGTMDQDTDEENPEDFFSEVDPNDRWLLWSGGDVMFRKWKEHVEIKVTSHL